MLLIASTVKLIAEIALFALAGQGVLALLAGARRDTNLSYRLLQILTRPFVRGARFVAPRVVLDRHLPLVAFIGLAFVWLAATALKIQVCLDIGVQACR